MTSSDWPHHATIDGELSRVSHLLEARAAAVPFITELRQDDLRGFRERVLRGIFMGNIRCSRNGKRIIRNDRRAIQISGQSRGYSCEEAGQCTPMKFTIQTLLTSVTE
jgi:hypothetical protein